MLKGNKLNVARNPFIKAAVDKIDCHSLDRDDQDRIIIDIKPKTILLNGPDNAICPKIFFDGEPDITTAPGAIILNGIGNILKKVRNKPKEFTRNSALKPFFNAKNLCDISCIKKEPIRIIERTSTVQTG
jgi:hypothetical protein|tara:strand:+ start:151 stop:540 length:390 start_codon:yes stop_codon:yes gene_type:complete